MKFEASRTTLLKAVTFAASGIQGRHTLPALNCVAVAVEFDTIKITGTNLDVWTSATCPATQGDNGGFCVSAALFLAFLKNAPGDQVTIEHDKDRITLKCGASKSKISVIGLDELPNPQPIKGTEISIPGEALKTKLDQVKYCQCLDLTRFTLNGVFAQFSNSKLSLAATDGRRMACSTFECVGNGEYIIPTVVIDRLAAAIEDGDVKCTFGENQVKFEGASWTITGRLIDGRYPNYRQVIPAKIKNEASISKEELISAIRRVKPFTTEKASSINLEFSKKSLTIRARNHEHEAEETIEDIEGFDLTIGFDPDYLLDAIAAVEGDMVTLGFIDELSPVKIEEGSYTAVVMPMRCA